MFQGQQVIIITVAVVFLIFILIISDHSLLDKIENKFLILKKVLQDLNDWTKSFQNDLLEIKNLLLQKRPMDLQILQKIMLYLSDEGLIEMPMMIFEKKSINGENFRILFVQPHWQLMIEIIAKYIEHDLKTDFPQIAYNLKENPDIIMRMWGEKLKEYFSAANHLLGN